MIDGSRTPFAQTIQVTREEIPTAATGADKRFVNATIALPTNNALKCAVCPHHRQYPRAPTFSLPILESHKQQRRTPALILTPEGACVWAVSPLSCGRVCCLPAVAVPTILPIKLQLRPTRTDTRTDRDSSIASTHSGHASGRA